MNDWYRLTFIADDISAAKHLEMEGHFEKFFLAVGRAQTLTGADWYVAPSGTPLDDFGIQF